MRKDALTEKQMGLLESKVDEGSVIRHFQLPLHYNFS